MSQRILLVQNDALAARTIMEALRHSSEWSFQVEWVKRSAEGLEKLDGVEAILVDLYLPDSRGLVTVSYTHLLPPGACLAGCRSGADLHRDKYLRGGVTRPGFRIRYTCSFGRDGPESALS